jgi:1-acyl-sn-glycerol-3-phosphate acyltransferase
VSSRPDSPAAEQAPPLAAARQTPARPEPAGWVYRSLWVLTRLTLWLCFRPRRRGFEGLPRRGGALLCANHQSWLDIPLIGTSLWRPVRFVARHTLGKQPLLALIMRRCGAILIQRGAADKAALKAIEAALSRGELVAIFPEGTRTRDGSVGPFRGGALVAARRAGVPLVPIGIRGSHRAWPRGQRLPRPLCIEAWVGPPRPPDAADLEALRGEVARLANAPLAEPPPAPALPAG